MSKYMQGGCRTTGNTEYGDRISACIIATERPQYYGHLHGAKDPRIDDLSMQMGLGQ